jgi:hypothetical protein
LRALGFGVLGANMGGKLLVALLLEVPQHIIKRFASWRISSVEYPGAFGATPTMETAFVDPYELACRSHLLPEDKISSNDVVGHYLHSPCSPRLASATKFQRSAQRQRATQAFAGAKSESVGIFTATTTSSNVAVFTNPSRDADECV